MLDQRSLREIAREHGITHQAIMGRRDREGWLTSGNDTDVTITAALKNTRTAQNALEPVDQRRRNIKTRHSWTPERAANIVAKIQQGQSISVAARSEGISVKSFERWREYDPELFAVVDEARFGHIGEMEAIIPEAAKRGDWRAATTDVLDSR